MHLKKVFLNTKGKNDKDVPKVLVDFLHYVDCSEEATLGEDADERLRRLHRKVCNIKNDRQMEVSYMKAEERDRLIREEGKREGLIQLIRKNVEKGKEKKKLVSS